MTKVNLFVSEDVAEAIVHALRHQGVATSRAWMETKAGKEYWQIRTEASADRVKKLAKKYMALPVVGNPASGRKSAGEQKMTFEKLHKPFKAWLSQVASEHGKPVEQVFAWWREYTQHCRNYDQSPVQSEFLDWYRDRLSAGGRVNPEHEFEIGDVVRYEGKEYEVGYVKRGLSDIVGVREDGIPIYQRAPATRMRLQDPVTHSGTLQVFPSDVVLVRPVEGVRLNPSDSGRKSACGSAGGRGNPDYTRFSPEEGYGQLLAYVVTAGDKIVFQSNNRAEARSWYERLVPTKQDMVFWSREKSTPGLKTILYKKIEARLASGGRGNPAPRRAIPASPEEMAARRAAFDEAESFGAIKRHRIGELPPESRIEIADSGTFRETTPAEWVESCRARGIVPVVPNPSPGRKSACGSAGGRGNPRGPRPTDVIMAEHIPMPGFPQIIVTRGFTYQHFKRLGWDESERGYGSLHYTVFAAHKTDEPLTEPEERDYRLNKPDVVEGMRRNPESGIKFVYGILGKGAKRVSEVQSVLFDKARYTMHQAHEWLKDHGFKFGTVDEGGLRAEYLRFRQQDPGKYSAMRTGEAGAKGNPMPTLKKLSEEIRHWGSKDAQRLPTELDTLGMVDRRFGPPVARSLSRKKIDSLVKAAREAFGERSNPSASALSEAFHGRPVKSETEYTDTRRTRSKLTELGALVDIEIEDPPLTIEFKRGTKLASSPNGSQLFVVGGDQSVDLKPFKADGSKDSVVLGVVEAVTYLTDKQHLGRADRTPGPYRHPFAGNGKEPPLLLYDTRNRELSFSGGVYKIEKDMDGGFSAGIKD